MMSCSDCFFIGNTDYGNIYLKRLPSRLMLKRFRPLDDEYMQEYIDNNADMLGEWQSDAYHWRTELGYDEWRENYDYEYSNWFTYDGETDTYYDENDSDTTYDNFYPKEYSKEQIVDLIIDCFNDDYYDSSFEGVNVQQLREKIGQFYDECLQYEKELADRNKPHCFYYYK